MQLFKLQHQQLATNIEVNSNLSQYYPSARSHNQQLQNQASKTNITSHDTLFKIIKQITDSDNEVQNVFQIRLRQVNNQDSQQFAQLKNYTKNQKDLCSAKRYFYQIYLTCWQYKTWFKRVTFFNQLQINKLFKGIYIKNKKIYIYNIIDILIVDLNEQHNKQNQYFDLKQQTKQNGQTRNNGIVQGLIQWNYAFWEVKYSQRKLKTPQIYFRKVKNIQKHKNQKQNQDESHNQEWRRVCLINESQFCDGQIDKQNEQNYQISQVKQSYQILQVIKIQNCTNFQNYSIEFVLVVVKNNSLSKNNICIKLICIQQKSFKIMHQDYYFQLKVNTNQEQSPQDIIKQQNIEFHAKFNQDKNILVFYHQKSSCISLFTVDFQRQIIVLVMNVICNPKLVIHQANLFTIDQNESILITVETFQDQISKPKHNQSSEQSLKDQSNFSDIIKQNCISKHKISYYRLKDLMNGITHQFFITDPTNLELQTKAQIKTNCYSQIVQINGMILLKINQDIYLLHENVLHNDTLYIKILHNMYQNYLSYKQNQSKQFFLQNGCGCSWLQYSQIHHDEQQLVQKVRTDLKNLLNRLNFKKPLQHQIEKQKYIQVKRQQQISQQPQQAQSMLNQKQSFWNRLYQLPKLQNVKYMIVKFAQSINIYRSYIYIPTQNGELAPSIQTKIFKNYTFLIKYLIQQHLQILTQFLQAQNINMNECESLIGQEFQFHFSCMKNINNLYTQLIYAELVIKQLCKNSKNQQTVYYSGLTNFTIQQLLSHEAVFKYLLGNCFLFGLKRSALLDYLLQTKNYTDKKIDYNRLIQIFRLFHQVLTQKDETEYQDIFFVKRQLEYHFDISFRCPPLTKTSFVQQKSIQEQIKVVLTWLLLDQPKIFMTQLLKFIHQDELHFQICNLKDHQKNALIYAKFTNSNLQIIKKHNSNRKTHLKSQVITCSQILQSLQHSSRLFAIKCIKQLFLFTRGDTLKQQKQMLQKFVKKQPIFMTNDNQIGITAIGIQQYIPTSSNKLQQKFDFQLTDKKMGRFLQVQSIQERQQKRISFQLIINQQKQQFFASIKQLQKEKNKNNRISQIVINKLLIKYFQGMQSIYHEIISYHFQKIQQTYDAYKSAITGVKKFKNEQVMISTQNKLMCIEDDNISQIHNINQDVNFNEEEVLSFTSTVSSKTNQNCTQADQYKKLVQKTCQQTQFTCGQLHHILKCMLAELITFINIFKNKCKKFNNQENQIQEQANIGKHSLVLYLLNVVKLLQNIVRLEQYVQMLLKQLKNHDQTFNSHQKQIKYQLNKQYFSARQERMLNKCPFAIFLDQMNTGKKKCTKNISHLLNIFKLQDCQPSLLNQKQSKKDQKINTDCNIIENVKSNKIINTMKVIIIATFFEIQHQDMLNLLSKLFRLKANAKQQKAIHKFNFTNRKNILEKMQTELQRQIRFQKMQFKKICEKILKNKHRLVGQSKQQIQSIICQFRQHFQIQKQVV